MLISVLACGTGSTDDHKKKIDVKINEVVSSNGSTLEDNSVGTPDWIELYNNSDTDVDLSGYGLSDNTSDFHKFVFDVGTVIPAKGYLLVFACEQNELNPTSTPCTGFGLSKNGDYLSLTDPYYEIISELKIPALRVDISYARRTDDSYGYCDVPTPGKANVDANIHSTVSSIYSSADTSGLVISEVNPSENAGGPWVEVHNNANVPVNLDDYYISDKESEMKRFHLPDYEVAPDGYAVIYMTGETNGLHEVETPFKIGKKDQSVFLSTIEGKLVDQCTWESDMPEGLILVHTDDGYHYTGFATPGEKNSDFIFQSIELTPMDDTDPIRINEVLQKNEFSVIDQFGNREPWVELYNKSDEAISLGGYFLSDSEDNAFRFALPDIMLEPDSYFVVFLSGQNTTDGEVHSSFKLGNLDKKLFLTSIYTGRMDSIELMDEPKDNISVGRDSDGNLEYYAFPTPGSKNANGFQTADSVGCFNSKGMFISEVSSNNRSNYDWIELYNGSNAPINISGWYLSDSKNKPMKYKIPDGTIVGAHEHYVLDTTSDPKYQKDEHVGTFGISAIGETIVLSDNYGHIADMLETGVMDGTFTVGRIEGNDTVAKAYFSKASKGMTNTQDIKVMKSTKPYFSDMELYHDEPFTVEIKSSNPNATIYYTTTGATPSVQSSKYSEPIQITETTCLKAVCIEDGKQKSELTTCTYLLEEKHDVPVITISIDGGDLHTVNDATKQVKPERAAFAYYYEPDGSLGTGFYCGMKAKGQGTLGYKQKSYSLSCKGKYGQTSVSYPFFNDLNITKFYSLVIRNGGQDSGGTVAKMRDSYASRIVRGMKLDYAATRPVGVYINGKYWGMYDLNEELNSGYLVSHYNVDPDTINFVKRNDTPLKGSADGYVMAREIARNGNLADDDVFAQFAEIVDVDYCADYIIAQTFIINSDMFNQKFWSTSDGKIKWRPVFYDLDFCLNEASSVNRNLLGAYFSKDGIPSNDGSITNTDVFYGLKKNAKWRQKFIERYVEILCTNFSSENLLKVFDEMVAERENEMLRHIEKWKNPSQKAWRRALDTLRRRIEKRPAAALQNLQDYFHLSDAEIDELVKKYSKDTSIIEEAKEIEESVSEEEEGILDEIPLEEEEADNEDEPEPADE